MANARLALHALQVLHGACSYRLTGAVTAASNQLGKGASCSDGVAAACAAAANVAHQGGNGACCSSRCTDVLCTVACCLHHMV